MYLYFALKLGITVSVFSLDVKMAIYLLVDILLSLIPIILLADKVMNFHFLLHGFFYT